MNRPRAEWEPGKCQCISALGTKAKQRFRRYLLKLQGGLCFYCDEELTTGWPRQPTLDHVVPLESGGADTEENVVLACFQCNQAKGCLTIAQLRLMVERIETFLSLRRAGSVPGTQENEPCPSIS